MNHWANTHLQRRPRLLNVLHALGAAAAQSGTTREELDSLARHARGRKVAIEIGTHMGVSAAVIAAAMDEKGRLYCVDPWPRRRFLENPSYLICVREVERKRVGQKIKFLRALSTSASDLLPSNAEFIFIDGDHSWEGISVDWALARLKLAPDGILCLHDTSIPPGEPARHPGSVDFFEEIILRDPEFELIEHCHSMNVLIRRG